MHRNAGTELTLWFHPGLLTAILVVLQRRESYRKVPKLRRKSPSVAKAERPHRTKRLLTFCSEAFFLFGSGR